MLALVLAAVLWNSAPRQALIGWLATVALVLGFRGWLGWAQRHAPAEPEAAPRWLRRFRIGHAVHGLVWGLASLLLFPQDDLARQMLMGLMLTVIVAGALNFAAFDLKAGLLFAVPTLMPLVVRLAAAASDMVGMMAVVMLLSLVFIVINTLHASRNARDSMALRRAETERADAARRREELLDRSGALANVGGLGT